MFRRDCYKKKKEAGLAITTLTGDKKEKVVCQIGARQDVRHHVKVRSLFAYHTEIECVARITTGQRVIRFLSPVPGDTEDRWTARGEIAVRTFGECKFSHVMVLSAQPYDEEHEIRVNLEVNRWQRGERDSASLMISVWS